MPTVTSLEVSKFRKEGYLLPAEPLFAAEQFGRLKDIFEELLLAKGPDDLDVPHFNEPRLMEFLLDDSVLDVVECILGPDFGLWSSHFISKTAHTGKKTPWHEDSAYWEGRFDRYDSIVTIWLAIDPATRENGCMKVIPGSHRGGGFSRYVEMEVPSDRIFTREIFAVDESKAVYLELQPNHYSLHDCRIIHGAEANTSDTRRTGYTMRYFSQQQKLNTSHPHNLNHKIWHCRGKNPHNNPVQN